LWHCTVVFIGRHFPFILNETLMTTFHSGSRDGIEEAMRRIKGVIRRLGTMSQNFI